MYRLVRKGFTAYLVGGGVRDLLLGRTPKDFDVSTNATPSQIKKIFQNCFLIGRRFRLAHIRFDDHVIETSTFRRCPDQEEENGDEDLYMFRDNCYGTPEEDALRRDFTINGLFYEVERFSIIDHVGGLSDIENRLIRCIGDPNIRFREDPVRMIRAVRFAARLDFHIEPATYNAIMRHHEEILKASPPRVFEELQKLFAYGAGEKAFRLLYKTGLLHDLLPEIADFLDHDHGQDSSLWAWLEHMDSRIRTVGKVEPVLVFAGPFLGPGAAHHGQIRGRRRASDSWRAAGRSFAAHLYAHEHAQVDVRAHDPDHGQSEPFRAGQAQTLFQARVRGS